MSDARAQSPFPAGWSVLFLAVGFTFTRLLVGLAAQHPWLANTGTFSAVAGVLLGLVTAGRLAWESSGADGRWVSFGLRAASLVTVVALSLTAMAGQIPHAVQWAALAGIACVVAVAGVRASMAALARRMWLPAATMGALVAGELLEMVGPPARYAAAPGTFWPSFADALGPAGEVFAFAGVAMALVWAVRYALRVAGLQRLVAFLAMPTALGLVLPRRCRCGCHAPPSPSRTWPGARFDPRAAFVAHPHAALVALYTLLFSGLLATSVSLASQFLDAGVSVRRCAGWVCVLMAGFGASTVAGPVDPLRAVLLVMGCSRLECAGAARGRGGRCGG
ncbi:MAG: hypothetical protein U0325_31760 [Polyangiales bacterium]